MSARRCRILLVDDSADDHTLFATALRRAGCSFDLLPPLYDGAQAIAYLSGEDPFANRDLYPLPDLLVLDLKMSCLTGHDVLQWLKTQSTPPVTVILSGSDRFDDVRLATALGSRRYFVKPPGWAQWLAVVHDILQHCPKRARLPRQP